MKNIHFGIRKDMQADVRPEPNACKGYVMDLSLGCAHNCIYCIFSPLEKKVHKLFHPDYNNRVIPLKIDQFLERKEFPPVVYLSYASDPLSRADIIETTKTVLKLLFSRNVSVFFLTKGLFTEDLIDVIRMRPDLMGIQVGITSPDAKRNKIIEPGAPAYESRLKNFEKLAGIPGLGCLAVRIDPLFPGIDDTVENIERMIADIRHLGVREAVFGYLILTEAMRESLKKNEYLRASMEALSEKTPTISNRSLFSFPLVKKVEKLALFQNLCHKKNVSMSVCGCKDERLKDLPFQWVCHPFNRKDRTDGQFPD
ncbi:MAG: radical SAM protein [Desulfobacterales bacterium]|nr:radical SAM protein [Desulfobacterales bacterium]